MERLDIWLKSAIRQEDNKGIMSGWLEEQRLGLVPLFSRVFKSFNLLFFKAFAWRKGLKKFASSHLKASKFSIAHLKTI